jgi:hypothetical protein
MQRSAPIPHRRAADAGLRRTLAARPARWALPAYIGLSILYWGRLVITDPSANIIAINDYVPSSFMWLFTWWPHALLHGHNPFLTHMIAAPDGYNLSWATSVPALSYAFSPITLAFGPKVAWNVVALLAPALSAWTAFLLCHRITRAFWASFLGGYLFGFSSYMVVHLQGLPQLTFVALLPLAVLLVVRHVEGSLSDRRFVVAMAFVLAGQFCISTEVFVTMALIGGVALVGAFLALRERRPEILRAAALIALACVGMALLLSPMLFFALFREHTSPEYALFGGRADLLSLVVPNADFQALSLGFHRWAGGYEYLGVPLVLLIGLFAWEFRRSRAAWVALFALAIAWIASLGSELFVGGSATGIPLPWGLIDGLPLLRYAQPVRLAVFVFLAIAVLAAMWLAGRGGVARWAVAVLAALALLPNVVGSTIWKIDVTDPAFFSSGAYKRYLTGADRVLVIPVAGENMRWQADAGFPFALVGGGFASYPEGYNRQPIWPELVFSQAVVAHADSLYRFVRDRGVTAIVVESSFPGPWRQFFGTLGARPREVGGVLFYRLGPSGLPAVRDRVVGAPADAYRLTATSIESSAGQTNRVGPGSPAATVQSSRIQAAAVQFSGRAGGGDRRRVVAFSGNRFVGVTRTVSSAYRLTIPLGLLQDRGRRPPVRLFALDAARRAVRLAPVCGPGQQYLRCS